MTESNVQAVANPVADMVTKTIQAQPKAQELAEKYATIPAIIPNPETSAKVGELIKQIRSHKKTLEDERLSFTKPINDVVTRINARFKILTNGLVDAMADLTVRNTVFLEEERRKADEAEARLRAEQEAKAAEEAARLEDEAKKMEDEAKAKQAEVDRLQAEGDAEKAEIMQREADARAKEAAATTAEAEMVLEEGSDAPAPIVMRNDKVRGEYGTTTGLRDQWKWAKVKIEDVPLEWLMLDESKITKAIRRADNPVRKIDGLRIFNEPKAVSR